MDSVLAHECLRRLICSVLRQTGFDAASPDALLELEDKLMMLLGGLLHIFHEYAELARRTRAVAPDFMKACQSQGISVEEMGGLIDNNRQNQLQDNTIHLQLTGNATASSSSNYDPTTRFLPYNDEDTKRKASYAPDFFPVLPPSHSYMQTPVYAQIAPPELAEVAGIPLVDISKALEYNQHVDIEGISADARMSQLDARIKTTRLVEASLQNLIRATSKASQKHQDINVEEEEESMQGGGAAQAIQRKQKAKENLLVLLKKYERDAGVCNFEVEWYPATTTSSALSIAAKEGSMKAIGSQFVGPQKKRGRWKV